MPETVLALGAEMEGPVSSEHRRREEDYHSETLSHLAANIKHKGGGRSADEILV